MRSIQPRNIRLHPPRLWLMTDERISGDQLLSAVARLPRGAGIVFRHYRLHPTARRALFRQVQAIARRRGLALLLAGTARQARAWRADGWHGGGGRTVGTPPRRMLHTVSAHDLPQIRAAERTGVDLVFLSPLFPTRSHPGGNVLGKVRFGLLSRQARTPLIALGGMTRARARTLGSMGVHGWAAIDGLSH